MGISWDKKLLVWLLIQLGLLNLHAALFNNFLINISAGGRNGQTSHNENSFNIFCPGVNLLFYFITLYSTIGGEG